MGHLENNSAAFGLVLDGEQTVRDGLGLLAVNPPAERPVMTRVRRQPEATRQFGTMSVPLGGRIEAIQSGTDVLARMVDDAAVAGSTKQDNPAILRRANACASASVDVLLLDAQYRQTLTCMRIYSRAGLSVGAVACGSEGGRAPSFRSRWCSMSATIPDFSRNADTFVDALLAILDEQPVRLIVPAHDGSIEALRTRREELERRVALPLASESALAIAVSKSRTMALAKEMGINVPRSVCVTDIVDVPAALAAVGCPAVVKPVESWAKRSGVGTRLSSVLVQTVDEAKVEVEHISSAGGQAIIQQWLPGRREAISLMYAHERFWARFAQISHREWPTLGGASVLCESIGLLPDITDASERLVRAIGLAGCSMVEFRRDHVGRPVLMEVNPRMAGSVALAVSAGVNFPAMLYDWALGRPLRPVDTYRTGRRLRWLAGDIWNLKCSFEDQGQQDVAPRGRALATFLSDFVVRPTALDFEAVRDPMPALVEMRETVLRHALGRIRRSPAVRWLSQIGKVE